MFNEMELTAAINALSLAGNDLTRECAVRQVPLIARCAPRIPDGCYLQPNLVSGGAPKVILEWFSADLFTDEETGQKRAGAMACFDLSPKYLGFWAQRSLQRIRIDKNLWLFADKAAIRTTSLEADEQLIKIGFGWLEQKGTV